MPNVNFKAYKNIFSKWFLLPTTKPKTRLLTGKPKMSQTPGQGEGAVQKLTYSNFTQS